MKEALFKDFLENDTNLKGKNGVAFRLSKGRNAEKILNKDLDSVVSDDDTMYLALIELQDHEDPKHNPMQNAVRKYYTFKNAKNFPQLRHYKKEKSV